MESSVSLKTSSGGFGDNKEAISSLFSKPESEQERLAEEYIQELLDSAADPTTLSSNQSCLNLCYLIDRLRKSKLAVLRNLAFSESTCVKLFAFYLEWSERHHQKAMRQVLDLTATLLSSHPDKSSLTIIKATVLERISNVISHKASQSMIKPAFKALEVFISKKSISSSDILVSYLKVVSKDLNGIYEYLDISDPENFNDLVLAVFHWMCLFDISPAAGRFLVALFVDLRKISSTSGNLSHASLWKSWIIRGLRNNPDSLENVKNYIFPTLFRLDRNGSVEFLRELTRQTDFSNAIVKDLDTNATLLLAAMEIGKVSGLVEDANVNEELMGRSKKRDQILLPERAIGNLLSHTSSFIRSAALSVLVTSTSGTRPFTAETLGFLKQNLGYMHADTDAHFRNNVLSSTRNMLYRLDCAIRYLADAPKPLSEEVASPSIASNSLLEIHLSFKRWYLEFLAEELIPTASYQRHVTALRAIMALPEMNSSYSHRFLPDRQCYLYSDQPTTLSDKVSRLVLDLMADPFEEVRSCSAVVLRYVATNPNIDQKCKKMVVPGSWVWNDDCVFGDESGNVFNPSFVCKFIEINEKAKLSTGRADLADGSARAHELLYSIVPTAMGFSANEYLWKQVSNLEALARIGRMDLAFAVRFSPVHGEYATLCQIVEHLSPDILALADKTEQGDFVQKRRWDGILQRLISSCQEIWTIVENVLCNDSPEGGSLPNTSQSIDTKELLSYSFRAIHESSNLMRAIVAKMNLRFADNSPFLSHRQFEEIGNLSFKQLASLRHRGAFSTVSLTFAKCCQQTRALSLNEIGKSNILQEWYQASLGCIFEQVSTTRRSAGIPALMTGILSANAEYPSFESVMSELESIARRPVKLSETDETNLPQVHAMNSMKEIFKSSALSKKSELHVAAGLQLAAESLQSDIWAIRNCGLILLRSLLDRMFGNYESKISTDAGWDGLSIKLSYEKYGALPDRLIKLLDVETDDERAIQSVMPALDIIRRAGPPDQHRSQIYDLVSRHLGSRVWMVRGIAARTMCTLMRDNWVNSAVKLLECCSEASNRCHGILLTLKHLLERYDPSKVFVESEFSQFVSQLINLREIPLILNGSIEVRAAYIEVLNAILKMISISPSLYDYDCIQELILHSSKLFHDSQKHELNLNSIYNHDSNSALFRKASGLQVVLLTAVEPINIPLLKQFVAVMSKKDPDTACVVLESIQSVWSGMYIQSHILEEHAEMYVAMLLESIPSQVQSIASRNLAAIIDELTRKNMFELPTPVVTDRLMLAMDTIHGSPELSNARIRLSGSLLIRKVKRPDCNANKSEKAQLEEGLIAWGEMLRDAGDANNDFDTRYAAVETLAAFYTSLEESEITACTSFVPSLLAVYDSLVDDNDEIRDVGATIVSQILGACLIPLAAQKSFFSWLVENYGDCACLCSTTLTRLTGGNVESVAIQLSRAMEEDDTLFVEEEQNLFIDEVRDVRIWAEILPLVRNPAWEGVVATLSSWVLDGMNSMLNSICVAKSNGTRGWTSNPQVFAICMRLILTANALIAHYSPNKKDDETQKAVVDGMMALYKTGLEFKLHESLVAEIRIGLHSTGTFEG